jgi:aspartate/methionine/tyrosine aminotransferase
LLCSSDAESVTVAELLKAANQSVENLLSLPLSYVESTGSLALRTAIAESTGPQLTPRDVLVCAGGQDAVLCSLVGLLKPDDHVLALMPTYQSLEEVPRGLGAKVEHVWLRPENQFRFDVTEILHRVSDRTKLVTLVNPHNPTGACLSRAEMSSCVLDSRGPAPTCCATNSTAT